MQKKKFPLSIGTIVFYTLFLLFIIAFVVGVNYGMGALNDWMVNFELSQPTVKSEEVFEELFGDPDWVQLYKDTQQVDTQYEGAESYKIYMEKLTAGKELTMVQTSAGLSGGKKYLVQLEGKTIADFILVDRAEEGASIPDWQLDKVAIYYSRRESVLISAVPGCTVYINGTALDDSHIISTSATLAEEYLKEGLHGYREQTYFLTGLLIQPVVTIQNAQGEPEEVVYDAEKGIHCQVIPIQEPSQEITDRAVEAAKAFSKYMIAEMNKTGIQKYFDKNGPAYASLPATWEIFMQKNNGYKFSEPQVSGYYQYSDSLYSIRVVLTMTVTRKDNTVKDYLMDNTFFFQKNADGKWLVYNKSNEDIQHVVTKVKLNFLNDGQTVESMFVDSNASKLTLPANPQKEGHKFLGWFVRETDESGKTTLRLLFAPSADGVIHLPEGTVLEHCDLYARFEKE